MKIIITKPYSFALPMRSAGLAVLLWACCGLMMTACSSSVRFAANRTSEGRSPANTSPVPSNTTTQTSTKANRPSGETSSAFEATDMLFRGVASYYGNEFHGRKTASGERYDRGELSAAHRTLPFGTMVRVRNTANDRSIVLRINDRGPWKETRVMDVSFAAAEALDMTRSGTANVEITVLK
ncbi:MAG: septal ring lytic transglycosylase RlpA family protein [Candidatus Kapaibacteriota bacterium]